MIQKSSIQIFVTCIVFGLMNTLLSCSIVTGKRDTGTKSNGQEQNIEKQSKTYNQDFDQVWESVIELIKKNDFWYTNDNGIVEIHINDLPCESLQGGDKACGQEKNEVYQIIALSQVEDVKTHLSYRANFKKKLKNKTNENSSTVAHAVAILGNAFFNQLDMLLSKKGHFIETTNLSSDHEELSVVSGNRVRTISVRRGNIRSAPTTKGSIIAVKERGDKLIMMGEENNWLKVKMEDGQIGWAHNSLFR